MRVRLLTTLLSLLTCSFAVLAAESETTPDPADSAVIFRFPTSRPLSLEKGFANNRQSIDSLTARIQQNRMAIDRGRQKIRVYGFYTPTSAPNADLRTVKERSNVIKSHLITHLGLKESNFRTHNRLQAYQRLYNAVVVVCPSQKPEAPSQFSPPADTERIEESPATPTPQHDANASRLPESHSANTPHAIPASAPTSPELPSASTLQTSPTVLPSRRIVAEHPRYIVALKTNALLLAATVANLGVEFGFGRRFSIDIPVTYSPYIISRDFRLQTLTIQPEFRCWFTEPMRGHFFGLHGHVGSFNVSMNDHTRYQDRNGNSPLWGVGLSYGYALRLSRCWGLEFTLGAGYANIRYDSFYNLANGAQISTATKNYWGVTRAGISIAYRIGQWGTQR